MNQNKMDLLPVYNTVNAILEGIDFNALFDGFHKYRFALYTSKEIAIDGEIIPYQDDFRGNTSISYEGEYIAIWDLEYDPVEDPEQFAYCLVHEMFHCHQNTNAEARYPNDLVLLDYPDNVENFNAKYSENGYLADAFEQNDIELLRKFAYIRNGRHEKYASMVEQEWKAETIEGMAEYIGLKALEQINPQKHRTTISDYLSKLREKSNLLFDARRISYYTGTVFFLCLEKFGYSIHNMFDSDITAYEQNPIDITGVTAEVIPHEFVSRNYAQLTEEKANKIKEHVERTEYIACDAFIYGYDPMNMFRVGNIVYCAHFVFLNENGNVKAIDMPVALILADGSNQSVIGYYV